MEIGLIKELERMQWWYN